MSKFFAVLGYLVSVAATVAAVLGVAWVFRTLLDRKIDEEIEEEMECGCGCDDCDCGPDCDCTPEHNCGCHCGDAKEADEAAEAAEA